MLKSRDNPDDMAVLLTKEDKSKTICCWACAKAIQAARGNFKSDQSLVDKPGLEPGEQ
jgi:hypothetical protein